VTRDRNGLAVGRPAGVGRGTHLAFVADGVPVEFELSGDRVPAGDLRDAHVDVNGALESFVLRDGPKGPIVAVAPSLAPIPFP
jgi:hypothetical protein